MNPQGRQKIDPLIQRWRQCDPQLIDETAEMIRQRFAGNRRAELLVDHTMKVITELLDRWDPTAEIYSWRDLAMRAAAMAFGDINRTVLVRRHQQDPRQDE